MLLVHGTADWRTPPTHASEMRSALEKSGSKVEWLAVQNEGHCFARSKNRQLYLETVVRFLDRHIGSDSSPAPGKP